MKVAELEGALLDYWVAKAEGKHRPIVMESDRGPDECLVDEVRDGFNPYRPSTDWSDCGPIIEREKISTVAWEQGWWSAYVGGEGTYLDVRRDELEDGQGTTPLIAAMRAYVRSKFGEQVEDTAHNL